MWYQSIADEKLLMAKILLVYVHNYLTPLGTLICFDEKYRKKKVVFFPRFKHFSSSELCVDHEYLLGISISLTVREL
jgi:hypothetical protein